MKKIVLGLLCFAMLIGQCKAYESDVISMDERKHPLSALGYDQHFSSGYYPNKYMDFKSGIVYTAQLEIQENMLSRLDWIFLENKSIDHKVESGIHRLESSIYKVETGISKLKSEISNIESDSNLCLNAIIGILVVFMLLLLSFLLYIGMTLNKIVKNLNNSK